MKNIIVVTGASSGIGKEFAIQISKKEKVDEIWVIARRSQLLNELKNYVDCDIVPIEMDLTNQEDMKKYQIMLAEHNPNIVILANCAGFGKFEHYENVETAVHLNMIDLNCKALISMTDLSLPYMKNGSKIMNVISCAGFQPIPYINVYAATKAFGLSYSRALNRELKYRGISVLAVCPYWTKTQFFNRAIKDNDNPVVINYDVLYDTTDVVKHAIKKLYSKADIAVYGFKNKIQHLGVKIFPHKMAMNVWLKRQKLDGTKENRKLGKK